MAVIELGEPVGRIHAPSSLDPCHFARVPVRRSNLRGPKVPVQHRHGAQEEGLYPDPGIARALMWFMLYSR